MKKFRFFLFLSLSLAALILQALVKDDDLVDKLLENLGKYHTENPQEKVHLHLDKPFYNLGEDIWFKAYLVNADGNQLSALSKVLYVELFDQTDSLKKTLVYPIQNGSAQGNITLTDSLYAAGPLRIRAYTKLMSDRKNPFLFETTVYVGERIGASVLADAQFRLTPKNTDLVLSGLLSYKDLQENPIADKDISYQIWNKNKLLYSGKGRLDQKGEVAINYTLRAPIPLAQLFLHTVIKTNKVDQVFKDFDIGNRLGDLTLQFFPEGGNLVNGIRSRVAFKAMVGERSSGAINGYIEDEHQNKLLDLAVQHAGMGLFALTPQPGKKYQAVVIGSDGSKKRFPLPPALMEGAVLTVNQLNSDEVLAKIDCSPTLVDKERVTIVVQANGVVKFTAKLPVNNAFATVKIPKKYLADGINQITLFSAKALPLAERLIFVHQRDRVDATIYDSQQTYRKNEQVNLMIRITDAVGIGTVGNYSMSVVDDGKVNRKEEDEQTIWSNLLLTSDLRGYIEQPNFYFTNIDQRKISALDLLMMTQGWRRFKWEDIQQYKGNAIEVKPETGLSISGTITNLNNKPIAGAKVNLFVPSMAALIDTIADQNGHFVFDELSFLDTTKFVIRAKNVKDRNNVKISLDRMTSPQLDYLGRAKIDQPFDQSLVNYLRQTEKKYSDLVNSGLIGKSIELKQVEIREKKTKSIPNSALPPMVTADYTLTPDRLQTSGNVIHILSGLSGLIIRYTQTEGYVVMGIYRGQEGRALILLDGVPINNLDAIDPRSLAGIQVIRGGSNAIGAGITFGGTSNADPKYGIVFLTSSRESNKFNRSSNTRLSVVKPLGYALTKEFYEPSSPQNGQDIPAAGGTKSTFYWNPNLITDERGSVAVNFTAPSEPGRYKITLEGITIDGKLLRKTFNFSVQ